MLYKFKGLITQRLEYKAFRTLSSSASASAASERLLERGPSKLKAGRARNQNTNIFKISIYHKGSSKLLNCKFLHFFDDTLNIA